MRTKTKMYAYLQLSWEATVASGDTKDEGIKVGELGGGDDGVAGLGGGVHLGQYLLRESLGNPSKE